MSGHIENELNSTVADSLGSVGSTVGLFLAVVVVFAAIGLAVQAYRGTRLFEILQKMVVVVGKAMRYAVLGLVPAVAIGVVWLSTLWLASLEASQVQVGFEWALTGAGVFVGLLLLGYAFDRWSQRVRENLDEVTDDGNVIVGGDDG